METSDPQTSVPESPSQRAALLRGNRTWLWLLLSLLLLGGGGFMLWRVFNPAGGDPAQMAQQGPQALPVRLQRVETGTVEDSSDFVGTLQAQQGIELRPRVEGRVTQIYVVEGQTVQQGDPIVELSPERSRAELNASLANVNAALASRTNAQAEVRAAEAERTSAAADVDLQNTEYERTRYLVAEGVQSQQQLDQVERNRSNAIAALQAAQERISAAQASVQQATATYNQAQADAEAVRSGLDDTLVNAPISGVVGDIPVRLGDYVAIGDTLTSITQNSLLELELEVPAERQNDLRVGLPVEITTLQNTSAIASPAAGAASGASANSGGGSVATGRISFISPTVNVDQQLVIAKAVFDNPSNLLQDEQRVEARLIWRSRSGVLIPVTSITRLGGETFVYVAETQQTEQGDSMLVARQRRVRLGGIQGNNYQVIEGVEAGEQLVVSGLLNLQDGVPIMPESENPSGQNPQAGGAAPGGSAPQ
ncbi:efflux RND transporter periplasmic adaptor subunit [Oculatella sp. LEGE 06141]|uniref:efflux RND transporter periplasmic adaptor subunit n=1 Tax=Oculatella sp. LEGE 06141 TaxID=1828648 RepID=UPI001881726B|nr:efflux RND transporter periplasmic adaptor subunit [Oculatella sp. LEGE 06141]MBE9179960.1 efflux RND transporter periplasmic adaptor subunit [Oculatella sp. LEGE 06141]